MGVPRFKQVPDHRKHPFGPYRQAPPEYGGEWWLANPFTTSEPWLNQGRTPPVEQLPAGFVEIFGPRPKVSDFYETSNPSLFFRSATVSWEQALRYFKRAGVPDWATTAQLSDAEKTYQYWGMGAAKFYEGRYGWMARFPESEIRDFESSAWGALNATHLVIAAYQLQLIERGIIPEKQHPFVPPRFWPDEAGAITEGG